MSGPRSIAQPSLPGILTTMDRKIHDAAQDFLRETDLAKYHADLKKQAKETLIYHMRKVKASEYRVQSIKATLEPDYKVKVVAVPDGSTE